MIILDDRDERATESKAGAVQGVDGSRLSALIPIANAGATGLEISEIAATTFAMESIVKLTSYLANDKKLDLRLESAACKEWNTVQAWKIIDDTMQIRGGRGYETATRLRDRGEPGWALCVVSQESNFN